MVNNFRAGASALFLAFTAAAGALSYSPPALAQANSNSESKYSAIVVDALSGEVLYGRRADSPRYPASVTKVMTLYLAFEALAAGEMKLTDQITISRNAASMQPTKLGVAAGRSISVEDAIQAIAIKSANDIATAMAEHLGGTESQFAAMMTLRAHELGMTQTRFVNAHGLPDPRQISTARDIAILSRSIMRDFPQYYGYFGQNSFTYAGTRMNNHNNLLRSMPGVDGLKTGFTNASGYNLAASAVQGDTRLISVVLGGTSNAQRDDTMTRLLNVGFDVARRRDSGEQIQLTQVFFEPREYARYQAQQEQRAAGTLTLASLQQAQGDSAYTPVSAPAGGFVVQVGAFREPTQAQTQLQLVNRLFADVFSGTQSEVGDPVNGFYRARFTGFTREAASQACARLQADRISCLVVAP
jgi:D-alanyl-D-alanine carboxypeptidase